MSTTSVEAGSLESAPPAGAGGLELAVRTPAGEPAGSVGLPAAIFDVPLNVPLIHQVVVAQLAAARQGSADTKTRAQVRGGGKKPYRQKGTGRARQGSTRAPQFAGGGVVHGPTQRDYSQRTPKKMKAAALRGALSDRARAGRVHVVTGLVDGAVPTTRTAVRALAGITERRHVLVVLERGDLLTWRSLRNVAQVHLLWADQLNTYDVMVCDDVVFTRAALDAFLSDRAPAASAGVGAPGAGDADATAEADDAVLLTDAVDATETIDAFEAAADSAADGTREREDDA